MSGSAAALRPTRAAVQKNPRAVIMLAVVDGVGDVANPERDFEWFETDKGITEFFKEVCDFAAADAADTKTEPAVHLLVPIGDTSHWSLHEPVRLFVPAGVEPGKYEAWRDAVTTDPTLALSPVAKRAPKAPTEVTSVVVKAKPVVKGRAKGAAAIPKDVEVEPPKPKARPLRGAARAAALQANLEAKREAADNIPVEEDTTVGEPEPPKPLPRKRASKAKATASV